MYWSVIGILNDSFRAHPWNFFLGSGWTGILYRTYLDFYPRRKNLFWDDCDPPTEQSFNTMADFILSATQCNLRPPSHMLLGGDGDWVLEWGVGNQSYFGSITVRNDMITLGIFDEECKIVYFKEFV